MTARIFDHHIHMDARNASDYELLALCGVTRVLVPCSFTGEPKHCRQSFGQRFDRLVELEHSRGAEFGVDVFIALAVNAEDIGDTSAALAAVGDVESRLENPHVCAIGELALRSDSQGETQLFQAQLRLAQERAQPVIVEACKDRKIYRHLLSVLETCFAEGIVSPARVCMFDLDLEKLEQAWRLDLGAYGVAVSPKVDALFTIHRKVDHREVLEIIDRYGHLKIMLGSGLHFGNADPLCLPKTLLRLRMEGVPDAIVAGLSCNNAERFFLNSAC